MQSRVLETAIGIVFVWFAASLIVSGVVEAIAAALRLRAGDLEKELRRWLEATDDGTPTLGARLKTMVKRLFTRDAVDGKLKEVAQDLDALGVLNRFTAKKVPTGALADAVASRRGAFTDGAIEAVMSRLVAQRGVKQLRPSLEKWFDERMKIVSTAYARRARWIGLVVGVIVAVVVGLDSFGVATRLYRSESLRTSVVDASVKIGATDIPAKGCVTLDPDALTTSTTVELPKPLAPGDAAAAQLRCAADVAATLTDLKLTIAPFDPRDDGFKKHRDGHWWGILATAAAIGAGAPFWFQALKRLLGMRSPKVT